MTHSKFPSWPSDFVATRSGVIDTARLLYRQYRRLVATARRVALLNPNKDSDVKVEGYTFALSKEVTLGIASRFDLVSSPDTNFRFQQLVSNAPCPGMFYILGIQGANVGCHQGHKIDAFNLKDLTIDYPTLSPANRIVVYVEYTGRVPHSKRLDRAEEKARRWRHRAIQLAEILRAVSEAKSLKAAKKIIATSDWSPYPSERMPDLFTFSIGFSGHASIVGY